MNRVGWVLWCLVMGVGCARASADPAAPAQTGQSYEEAIQLICEVDQRAGIDGDADPIDASVHRWDFIRAEVKNPDGIYFRTLLEAADPAKQAAMLQCEAESCGLPTCQLAESFEESHLDT